MANKKLVALIRQGADAWNDWREYSLYDPVDLTGANLTGVNLSGMVLNSVNFNKAKLSMARFFDTSLPESSFREADLRGAIFRGAFLNGTNLSGAKLWETVFANVDLSGAKGLDSVDHLGPSTIDYQTLARSGLLPPVFLRGFGLPDLFIDYLPSLLNRAIEFYSLFISYSLKDQGFATRLHADLQDNGVRCWFSRHDMRIGDDILDTIGQQIRVQDKILLILSSGSISSDWVKDEVTMGFEEERKRKPARVLFPVRIDDAVMDTAEPWASKLRARHIGNFTNWKNHDAYQAAFERLLRDLKKEVETEEPK